MRSFLIRCYPARWRARYGDEFEAILEERPLGPFDVADIFLGALDAQLRLRGRRSDIHHGKGLSMSLRIGGFAAILGGAFFAMSIVLGIGMVGNVASVVPGILFVTGSLALLRSWRSAVSHLVGRELGGVPERDIPAFAAMAAILVVAGGLRWRHVRPATR